jgi:hypothetical protein
MRSDFDASMPQGPTPCTRDRGRLIDPGVVPSLSGSFTGDGSDIPGK